LSESEEILRFAEGTDQRAVTEEGDGLDFAKFVGFGLVEGEEEVFLFAFLG
jgi:hypothetical protein